MLRDARMEPCGSLAFQTEMLELTREDLAVRWADFEEKEYEVAFAVELGSSGGGGPVLAAGVVAEKLLGYDAASDPARTSPIWQVLGVPRPKGVKLLPQHWTPGIGPHVRQIPSIPVSLILQYKRPEYLRGANAKQWHRWGQPYYRFTRSAPQHEVLRRIERRLMGGAVVRYAAPAFHERGQFESAILRGSVVAESGFVAPATLGSHRVWTYQGPGKTGYANPDGPWERFASMQDVFSAGLISGLDQAERPAELVPVETMDSHLSSLAAAVGERWPTLRSDIGEWMAEVERANLGLDDQTRRRLFWISTVATGLSRIGASWHVFAD
jgi:hypothetical protein